MRWIPATLCIVGALLGCDREPAPGPSVHDTGIGPPAGEGAMVESAVPAEGEPEPAPARRAEVGIGKKGHGYGTGPIGTPLAVRWRAAERLVFDVQIPHAMNLFKATNGRAPDSHEEFMKEIVELNRISLPELSEGQYYLYDPAREQLMVYGPQPDRASPD